MTDDDTVDDLVLTNPKLPHGWRLIDRDGGRVVIAEEDAPAGCRNWLVLERKWLRWLEATQ
jgi:hypothetical protein